MMVCICWFVCGRAWLVACAGSVAFGSGTFLYLEPLFGWFMASRLGWRLLFFWFF